MRERLGLAVISSMVLTVVFGAVPSDAQDIPYRTSFEEPTFTTGTLNGQDGWQDVSFTGAGSIQRDEGVHRGDQALRIQPAAEVSRGFTGAASSVVYIDGFYRGPTVSVTPEASSLPAGTSILLFHETLGILALDGDGSGGGTWQPAGVPVAASGLQRITIRQNYDTSTWDLFIDGELKRSNLGFKNNSISRFNGINIETSEAGPGFLDDFAVTTDPPDFLAEPVLFYFQKEWARSGEKLNWDLAPLAPDNEVDAEDLLELLERLQP